eukprot:scaffold195666_cov33-Tisochrysis_lutea.AAC.3
MRKRRGSGPSPVVARSHTSSELMLTRVGSRVASVTGASSVLMSVVSELRHASPSESAAASAASRCGTTADS